MSEMKPPKEISYGLVEQFRKLAKRIALPDLNLYATAAGETPGYEFTLRNPWYTTIPVSSVTSIALMINGYEVDAKTVFFVIRDQAIPFAYAKNLHELCWGNGECAKIRILDDKLPAVLKERNNVGIRFLIRTAFVGYHLPDNRIEYLFDEEMGVK